MSAATSADAALTVWYDGGCPLCRREIALLSRLDRARRIEFVDLTAQPLHCPLEPALLLARLHAREGERLHSGAAAFAAMWRQLPLLRPLGLAAQWPPLLAAMEWLYLRFLKVRPWLQRRLRA